MYLHLGQNTLVRMEDIVGVFDLDTSTISKHTKNFLKKSEQEKKVINITNELPKSFIVCDSKKYKRKSVMLSQISPITIKKRSEKPQNYLDN